VKWFKADKGFGFVVLGDGSGEAFLHITVLEGAGHTIIQPGAKLRVQVGRGQKGRQVTAVVEVLGGGVEARPKREFPRSARRTAGLTAEVPGTVKWYDVGKGFGFAEAEDGQKDVFLHVSVLKLAGLSELVERQRIVMQVVADPRGRKAVALRLIEQLPNRFLRTNRHAGQSGEGRLSQPHTLPASSGNNMQMIRTSASGHLFPYGLGMGRLSAGGPSTAARAQPGHATGDGHSSQLWLERYH
jgi:cold shock protein